MIRTRSVGIWFRPSSNPTRDYFEVPWSIFKVIEGARYDLSEHVEALRDVVADLKAGRIEDALELLEHELGSVEAVMVALSSGEVSLQPRAGSFEWLQDARVDRGCF